MCSECECLQGGGWKVDNILDAYASIKITRIRVFLEWIRMGMCVLYTLFIVTVKSKTWMLFVNAVSLWDNKRLVQ